MMVMCPTLVSANNSVSYLELSDLDLDKVVRDKYEWKSSLIGESYEEGINKEVGTSAGFDIKLTKLLNEHLYLKFEGGIGYGSANTQMTISDLYSDRLFRASEATVNFGLAKHLRLSAGNISQEFFDSPLFVNTSRSFPGLSQDFYYNFRSGKLGLRAQQTIPTSKSFNIDRDEKEEIPAFFTGSLYLNLKFDNPFLKLPTSKIGFDTMASLYQFSKLPTVVAFDGGLKGHELADKNKETAKFKYEFSGYLVNTNFYFEDKNNYKLGVKSSWGDNLKASNNDRLQSNSYYLKKVFGDYKVSLEYEDYFKDSEVTPAVYSASSYGGNNREGQAYKLELEFTKLNFKIEAALLEADTITANTIQKLRKNYYLGVETLYVEF